MTHTHSVHEVASLLHHVSADFEDAGGRKFRKRTDGALTVKMPGRWTAEISPKGIRACNARIGNSLVSCAYHELVELAEAGKEGAKEALDHVHQAAESIKTYLERKALIAGGLQTQMAAA